MPNTTTKLNIPVSHLHEGDLVTLPGSDQAVTVNRAWFNPKTGSWSVQIIDDAHSVVEYPSGERNTAILHDRPGYGPFTEVYEVGDRVICRWGSRDNLFGVVEEITIDEDDPSTLGRCYTIRTSRSQAWATAESMRREGNPRIRVGQRWEVTPDDRPQRIAEVKAVDDLGVKAVLRFEDTGFIATYVMRSPWWTMISGPVE